MLKLITISYIIMFTQNRIKQYLLYFQISPRVLPIGHLVIQTRKTLDKL